MLKTSTKKRKSQFSSRLKAFSSFSDSFNTGTIKSAWKQNYGSWNLSNNTLTSSSSNAAISIPVSKSDATATINLPSAASGVGVLFWSDGINYWAAYPEISTSTGPSNCNNGLCSGTENYTATRSCSCSNVYGTCSSSSYTSYGTCAQTTGTCSGTVSTTYGTCSSSTSYIYDICEYSVSTTYGTCSSSSTTITSYEVNDGGSCAPIGGSTVGCSNCAGGGPCGTGGFVCCRVTYSSTSWNYSGCSYNGELVATGTSTTWNYPGCSYSGQVVVVNTRTVWNYAGCSYDGQTIATGSTTSWNYPGCSSNGQTVVTGWNYGGCSYVGQQVVTGSGTSWNYGGCSSNGQQVLIGQNSSCSNGSCSGTENYTATRSCSCSISTNRVIKVIKYENGSQSIVGSFNIGYTPTQIQVQTSGNNVTVIAGGNSGTYVNSSTKPKRFGIYRTSGILEQGNSVSSFSVLAG